MNYSKMTKAQLVEELKKIEAQPERPQLGVGNLILRRDPKVKIESTEKNPVYGYINVPEGVSGSTRMAIWADLDADGNVIPGRFRARSTITARLRNPVTRSLRNTGTRQRRAQKATCLS